MIQCPMCGQDFEPDQGEVYLSELYCSPDCAKKALEEGRDTNEPVEAEAD